jgi:hypothetical protein
MSLAIINALWIKSMSQKQEVRCIADLCQATAHQGINLLVNGCPHSRERGM